MKAPFLRSPFSVLRSRLCNGRNLLPVSLAILAVLIALAFTACSSDSDDGDSEIADGTIAVGKQVKLYVYEGVKNLTASDSLGNYTETKNFGFIGDEVDAITTLIPNSIVQVTSGKLTMTLGIPNSGSLTSLAESEYAYGATVSPAGVKYGIIGNFNDEDAGYALACIKSNTESPFRREIAFLLYADNGCTVKGPDTNFTLNQGWNYLIETSSSDDTTTLTSPKTLPSGFNWVVGNNLE